MNSETHAPLEESQAFLASEAEYLKKRKFFEAPRANKIKFLAEQQQPKNSEIDTLRVKIASLISDAKAHAEAKSELEVKISKITKDLHESLEELGYKYEEKEWTMVYAPFESSWHYAVVVIGRTHGNFTDQISEYIEQENFNQQQLHEWVEQCGHSFKEQKWIQEEASDFWKKEVMKRQDFECAGLNCKRISHNLQEGFFLYLDEDASPKFSPWKFKQKKSKKGGHGFHSSKQIADYRNMEGYCEDCYKDEQLITRTFRISTRLNDRYEKFAKSKPNATFTSFITKAFHKELSNYEEEYYYKEHADFFLTILAMYNDKENDDDFAEKIIHFFKFYNPPMREIWTDDEINSYSSNEDTANWLRKKRNEDIKTLINNKRAGYGNYENNFEEFTE